MIHSGASEQRRSRTTIPHAQEILQVASHGYSFQTRELLQRIVSGEQQRIREEQMLWRLGGALLGTCLGLGDGFQAADVFLGMGFSSLAGLTHEVLSEEDRRFLEGCHSLWTIGCNSPLELAQRLGPARSRILLHEPQLDLMVICSHHQGHRGDTLVPLNSAERLAAGFQQPQSLEVMKRHLSSEELEIMRYQLYPNAASAIPLDSIQPISSQQAIALAPAAAALLPAAQPMQIQQRGESLIGFRIPIPAHSDF